MSESQTLASSKIQTLAEALKKASSSMSAVAARMVTADRLIKIALAAAQRSPDLLECSAQSIVRSVIQGAELGLSPGSALNHAYLVPFRNKDGSKDAQLIVSAQGLCELMYRSGMIAFVSAEVVYQGDEFEYELGLNPKLRHVPKDETVDPSKITHAYMVVGLKDGSKVFRVMTKKGIDAVRAGSKAGSNGPWVTHYSEMARKTVIKNGSKYVPKSIEVARAIAHDNAAEAGEVSFIEWDAPESLEAGAPQLPESTAVSKLEKKLKDKAATVPMTDEEFDAVFDSQEEEPTSYDGPTVKA